MGIYTPKTKTTDEQYREYIHEHISNVQLAYEKYGEAICKALNINAISLEENIREHDKTKFYDEEFKGYRQWFYPEKDEAKDRQVFDKAWFLHLRRSPHHPEFWTYVDDNKVPVILDMPTIYIAEMLLDWAAMGIKFGDTAYEYYQKVRNKKPFNDNTKEKIDSVIEIFK